VTATGRHRRIDRLPPGEVHAVGPAGLETASLVRYLVENGREDIVLHDTSSDLDAAFLAAHRLQPDEDRHRARAALGRCRELRSGADYLAGIESATTILAPVSWFLHAANAPLEPLRDRFLSYADACIDLWPGRVIGVTGSYGKTTTTRFVATLTDGPFCGNDREALFDLAHLARQPGGRCLAFEASNRHLANRFDHMLDVGVLTGIALNHEPDHGSFEAYRRTKYSLATKCRTFLYHQAIPAAFPDAGDVARRGSPYGERGAWRLVADALQCPDGVRCPLPGAARLSPLDRDNATAAAAAALICGEPVDAVGRRSLALAGATPRYRQEARDVAGRQVVNDAASCMPACTAALVEALDQPFVLICGGDRQRYRPGEFDQLAAAVHANPHAALVCATGPMAGNIAGSLRTTGFDAIVHATDLDAAVERALDVAGAAVVFSPGCGTGSQFTDKYARGEAFDDAVSKLVSNGQAVT
jgi:UDP-N-acetylmuramoylalanine-D-glutamate ligase